MDGLALKNAHKTLITRKAEVSKLTDELLASFDCYCLKDTVVDGESAFSETGGSADLQRQDIHAKLYFKTKSGEHNIYVGSANCSKHAWDGNVEFMLRIKYEKWGFRISQIIDELFGRNNKDYDERQNPFERIIASPEATLEKEDIQERLKKAIKRLCRSRKNAQVIENSGKYSISIQFDRRFIAADVDLAIAALGGGKSVKLESTTLLPGLSLSWVSFILLPPGLVKTAYGVSLKSARKVFRPKGTAGYSRVSLRTRTPFCVMLPFCFLMITS